MTILTTKKTSSPALLIDSLPEHLQQLIDSPETDWSGNLEGKSSRYLKPVAVIEKNGQICKQLVDAIAHLESILAQASLGEIGQELARLRLHFPMTGLSEEQVGILMADYLEDMAVYPIDIIKKACASYRRKNDSQFFPKIAQLLKLMNEDWYERKYKLKKLKTLLEKSHKGN